ncbi:hypothetical protein LSTR_LSTR010445 [Laodelphax striatellus]|uniref:Ionotropic glutamate receptor C-terminal domain-containing protein n=1 Tax=Laodelphax striatellus TaxID=195883 RepID=A0A482WWB2_LAOST|nr:hypothetical protein LSTR_LSTR010445 [Laodelphax striatellus]
MNQTNFVGLLLTTLCSNYPPESNLIKDDDGNFTTRAPDTGNTTGFECTLKDGDQLEKDILRGKHLRIATFRYDWPMSRVEKDKNGVLRGSGIAFQIIETLRKQYGFTYSIVAPSKDILGDEKSGILELLHNRKVDMAAAFLPVLHGRYDSLSWGTELIQNKYYVLMKRPKESATGSGLLAPFEDEVWLLILVSLLLVGPTMYAIIKLRDRLCGGTHSRSFSLSSCAWFVYGALMKQGSTLNPATDSSRVLFATWWVFIMILTAFYTANLTAFLTLSRFTLPIQNIDDIARLSYHWFTRDGGILEFAIKVETDLNVLRYSAARGFGHFVNVKNFDQVKSLIAKDWLYLEEKRELMYFMMNDYINKTMIQVLEKDRCTYVLTADSYLTRSTAFAYPKHSILPALFNRVMLSYVESGIINHLASYNSLSDTQICPLNLHNKERQLRNADLLTTYYVVVSGFITAAVVLVCEIIWRKLSGNGAGKAVASWKVEEIFDIQEKKPRFAIWRRAFNSMLKDAPRKEVNGREYYVVRTKLGEERLIPVRPLSSFLFQKR